MNEYYYHVDEISSNKHMGKEYKQTRAGKEITFLFGKTLKKISPDLELKTGDVVRITKDDKHDVIKIEKVINKY